MSTNGNPDQETGWGFLLFGFGEFFVSIALGVPFGGELGFVSRIFWQVAYGAFKGFIGIGFMFCCG